MEKTVAKKKFQKVQVWIHCKGMTGVRKVLILKTTPQRGEFWQPVTGGVGRGETPIVAALREAREETGTNFVQKPKSLNYKFKFDTDDGIAEEFCFSLEVYQMSKVRLDPTEHTDFMWLEIDQAMKVLKYPSNQEGLRRITLKTWPQQAEIL